MKLERKKMLDLLAELDPAAHDLIKEVRLHLGNGEVLSSDNVTVQRDDAIWARDSDDASVWHVVPKDTVVGTSFVIDEAACRKHGVPVDLPDVINWSDS